VVTKYIHQRFNEIHQSLRQNASYKAAESILKLIGKN